MNNLLKRFCAFIVLATVDTKTLSGIILALAERQPNGRTNYKSYENARKIANLLRPLFPDSKN